MRFFVLLAALGFAGCGYASRLVVGGITPDLPQPYQSTMTLRTEGKETVEHEIIGEGYGSSTGRAVLFGALFHTEPDVMDAYHQAVKSRGGDILIESRSQTVYSGFLAPLIYSQATTKVWGLVVKIKRPQGKQPAE
jgi:hypothetical protein